MDVWAVRLTIAGDGFHVLADEAGEAAARGLAGRLAAAGTVRLRPRVAPRHLGWDVPGGRELTADEPPPLDREQPGSAWRDVPGSDVRAAEPVLLPGPVPLWHWAVVDGGGSGTPDAVG